MHHVLQKLDLYDTSSIITCRGTWYSVAYCKGLACGLHNLVLLQWGKKWTEEGGGGGGGEMQLSSQTRNICLICVTCFLLI